MVHWGAKKEYGWAMSQNLPCTFLRWEKAATFTQILKTPDDSPKGYIVEVVLEFPQHLHDKYKELSTMPGIPDSQDGGSVSSNREIGTKSGTIRNDISRLRQARPALAQARQICNPL